eukprot:SAG22_NODE_1224_length_5119_cov_2.362550_3_plen_129_part_00
MYRDVDSFHWNEATFKRYWQTALCTAVTRQSIRRPPIDDGATPLFIAAQNGHLAVVKLLLDRGATIDQADNAGATPLHAAADIGHEAIAKLLLARGADRTVRFEPHGSPAELAASQGHMALAELLKLQ